MEQVYFLSASTSCRGVFPAMTHVKALGLIDANDYQIFMYARQQGFSAILTQDEDFYSLLLEHGIPPKVIRLRRGNCSTASLAAAILSQISAIDAFIQNPEHDCLEIY